MQKVALPITANANGPRRHAGHFLVCVQASHAASVVSTSLIQ
jgi:hypothetical protein